MLDVAVGIATHEWLELLAELDPADMFFHRFGATLIGACHGDRMKPDRMAMSMATATSMATTMIMRNIPIRCSRRRPNQTVAPKPVHRGW